LAEGERLGRFEKFIFEQKETKGAASPPVEVQVEVEGSGCVGLDLILNLILKLPAQPASSFSSLPSVQ
jgi:hypothetical protein